MSLKITVFTPTYNRAYIIENLYRSLLRQSFKNFEWIVIDDGSTDETEELFEKWVLECKQFNIRYYKQQNGGKCRAINKALDLAKGELFFVVDSDDYLTDDALEKISLWEWSLPSNGFCGVSGNLGISENETPNSKFEGPFYDGTALDRYGTIDGERAFAFYTDIHRLYKYPEFENEKFMTEAVVWNRMAHDGYKIRFYNDIIWIYEYQEDGLTKSGNSLFLNNPYGYGLWLREKNESGNNSFKEKLKLYYSFTCELEEKYSNKTIAKCIGTSSFMISALKAIHKIIHIVRR